MSKCVRITGYVEEKGKQLFGIGQIVSLDDDVADRLVRVKAAVLVDANQVAGLVNQVGETTFKVQTDEIKDLRKVNGHLKTENEQLMEENDQLKKLIESAGALSKENGILKTDNEKLAAEVSQLAKQVKELSEKGKGKDSK